MTVSALKPKLTSAREAFGYVHGFDQFGQQIVEFCGPYAEVAKKIQAAGVEIKRSPAVMKGDGT